jgi:hypothetical protein
VDTDVIVILIGKFNILKNICPAADIWVAFGVGKRFTYIPINSIAEALGEDKCVALPAFHSFTGCDTVSSFYGKGKKKAWEAWKCYPKVTDAFQLMAKRPYTYLNIETEHFMVLERFTVVLYDKTSSMETVNETRRDMFCQKASQWMPFHQHRMRCCNTRNGLPTRQVSGPRVTSHSNKHLLLKTGAGCWIRRADPGLLCGQRCL